VNVHLKTKNKFVRTEFIGVDREDGRLMAPDQDSAQWRASVLLALKLCGVSHSKTTVYNAYLLCGNGRGIKLNMFALFSRSFLIHDYSGCNIFAAEWLD
jgi:hypothetical protein